MLFITPWIVWQTVSNMRHYDAVIGEWRVVRETVKIWQLGDFRWTEYEYHTVNQEKLLTTKK
jgi:hypothetical protein